MKLSTLMLTALLLLIFIGCKEDKDHALDTVLQDTKKQESHFSAPDTIGGSGVQNKREEQKPDDKARTTNQDWEKKIIKVATLNIEVKDYGNYYNVLRASVKRVGGYIAQEDQSQSEYKIENIVSIKVPVSQFDEAVSLFVNGTGNEKLIEKRIGSEDVTGQVIDTKSRLEAKRQVRLRYLELLKQAKNMEEVLQVQSEINDLQEQIEMAAGRMSFLTQSAAYSTINLTFFHVLNPLAPISNEPSFFVRMGNAFENGWDFIKHLLLGLITIWPLLLIIAGLWVGLRKWKFFKPKTT